MSRREFIVATLLLLAGAVAYDSRYNTRESKDGEEPPLCSFTRSTW